MIAYCQVSAFTETPGHGNQAGVVVSAQHLSDIEMQGFAARLGVPETVFITDRAPGTVRVRYFTPTQEIEFCGHATVALGLVLVSQGLWQGEDLQVNTLIGQIPLSLEAERGVPKRIWMQQRQLEVRPVPRELRKRIAGALGIDERLLHRGLPLSSASTGLWTTFVPVVDSFVVDALDPDMHEITA